MFQQVNVLWGPIDLDLSASRLNKKCKKYFSWFPDPQALATDAFAQDWSKHQLCFLNPPWILLSVPGDSSESNGSGHCTTVAKSTMVQPVTADGNRSPTSTSSVKGPGPRKVVPTVHQESWLTAWLVSGSPSKQMVLFSLLLLLNSNLKRTLSLSSDIDA